MKYIWYIVVYGIPDALGANPSSLLIWNGIITTMESQSNKTNLLLQVSLSFGSWASREESTVRRSDTWKN